MVRSRTGAALAAVTVMLALSLGTAPNALADPAGCTSWTSGITQFSGGELWAQATGQCNAYGSRTLNNEIKQDIAWAPDPVALYSADSGWQQNYVTSVSGCDHNNIAVYYSRAFFSGHTDYKDSAHRQYDVC